MPASVPRGALLIALSWSAIGCHKAWRADTMTPPIQLGSTQEARTSLPAVIMLRDMELPRFVFLSNSVYFVAVSKDRLRFHVTLNHKWEDMSDPTRWRVWIEDDHGHRYAPSGVDRRVIKPVTRMFEQSGRSTVPDPLYSVTVYKGDGDYVFYRRDIVRKDMRYLVLVMQRPGYEYRYRWSFVDDSTPEPESIGDARSSCRVRQGKKCAPIVASPSR